MRVDEGQGGGEGSWGGGGGGLGLVESCQSCMCVCLVMHVWGTVHHSWPRGVRHHAPLMTQGGKAPWPRGVRHHAPLMAQGGKAPCTTHGLRPITLPILPSLLQHAWVEAGNSTGQYRAGR